MTNDIQDSKSELRKIPSMILGSAYAVEVPPPAIDSTDTLLRFKYQDLALALSDYTTALLDRVEKAMVERGLPSLDVHEALSQLRKEKQSDE